MNSELSMQLYILLQICALCQNSQIQHVKHHLRSMFNSHTLPHGTHIVQHYVGPPHGPYYRAHAPSHLMHRAAHYQHRKYRVPVWRSKWNTRHKSKYYPHYHHKHPQLHFTPWSIWSACSKECIKRRERFCRNKRKCGKIKHVEEQKCWNCVIATPTVQPQQDMKNSPQVILINTLTAGTNISREEKHKKPKRNFHEHFKHRERSLTHLADYYEGDNVSHEEDENNDFDIEPYALRRDEEENEQLTSNGTHWIPLMMQDAEERPSLDTTTLSLKYRRIYSKWSRWSKCSPKCTTTRFKKCRLREHCGREVLREISYCYTEGSFCQQWLQAQLQVQNIPSYEMRPMASHRRLVNTHDRVNYDKVTSNNNNNNSVGVQQSKTMAKDIIMNGKGYMGTEYMPQKLKCGIAPIHKKNNNKNHARRRNMNNMLKIIGGRASSKGEWPWQVAVFNRFKEAFCGGTLIAPQWVLTAAHCVRKVLYVSIGEHNLDNDDGTEMQLRITRTFKHPNFDKRTVDSDVALLKLPRPINTTNWIDFSCLPRPYQSLPSNTECTIIGWGKRRNRDVAGTNVLHQADVPIIPMENCRLVYQDYTITKNMFCAGHKRGRIDTCAGDSGGPLLCRDITKPNHPWTIFGITSFGDGCAKRNKFGIYTKVPNYVDWVWSVINCNGNCKLH